MKLKSALLATAFAFTALSTLPALAHDEWDNGHRAFHDQLLEAHERAHEEGFESRAEHRAYHRALRDLHGNYHEDRGDYSYYRPRYHYYYPNYRSWGW
ncbi:hypothetical protein HZZ13_01090 [Bradyrhizobium sp. CNPSo 4010]|uniref:Uncharacterized protein n=1 Tax=Bradyrhizobium agreste TaxID=2751811 RepID=A0ABS0PGU4_9BRAD|nr:hypothetical protein [Bradyrhizobium agreste]MBH5396412.1 hypothetical protein [Bradyrhizobium agreste]